MRRISVFLLTIILIFAVTACGKTDLQKYRDAVSKLDTITSGKSIQELKVESEFNLEGLTSDEIKELYYYNTIQYRSNVQFDNNIEKVIARNYSNFGGMGFDSIMYINGNDAFLKMPIVGKYYVMDKMINSDKSEDISFLIISEKSIKAISQKWVDLLNNEDVVSGEKSLLSTEDGEVKATRFTINLSEEQLKTLINDAIIILKTDDNLKNMYSAQALNMKGAKSLDEVFENLRLKLSDIEISNIRYESYIDIDGYIVQKNIEMEIKYSNVESGEVERQKIVLQSKTWDIGNEQMFDFPELTDENTLEQDNINQGIPFLFENLFDNAQKEGQ